MVGTPAVKVNRVRLDRFILLDSRFALFLTVFALLRLADVGVVRVEELDVVRVGVGEVRMGELWCFGRKLSKSPNDLDGNLLTSALANRVRNLQWN